MTNTPSITFWHVTDAKQKVSCICNLVHRFFQQSKRQLIVVPNDQAADYVNKLLWKFPRESFIPHAVSSVPLAAAIVITTTLENLNKAEIILNLCAEATPLAQSSSFVHELMDGTDPKKEELSLLRKSHYEKAGYSVVVQSWTD